MEVLAALLLDLLLEIVLLLNEIEIVAIIFGF